MVSSDQSFVDVADCMEEDSTTGETTQDALTLKVAPHYERIGIEAAASASETHVCATLTAGNLSSDRGSPVDVVVALDISGSMRGSKLQQCKSTLELLLRHLTPQDRFGLVVYASNAQTFIPLQHLADKTATWDRIKDIRARGSTNMSAALSVAFQEHRSIADPNEVRSIFFLTDGHATSGIRDQQGLVELVRNLVSGSAPSPPSLFCFGYGTTHNTALLREMANAADGGYYAVEQDDDVAPAFGDALGGLLSVVAQGATVTIKACEGATIVKVHHDKALLREDGSYTVNVGDLYAEETRDVLFKITLPQVAGKVSLATVSACYTDVSKKTLADIPQTTCEMVLVADSKERSGMNSHVQAQILRIKTIEGMEGSRRHAAAGDYTAAHAAAMQTRATLSAEGMDEASATLVNSMKMDIDESLAMLEEAKKKKKKAFLGNMDSAFHGYKCQRTTEVSYDKSLDGKPRALKKKAYKTRMKMRMTERFRVPVPAAPAAAPPAAAPQAATPPAAAPQAATPPAAAPQAGPAAPPVETLDPPGKNLDGSNEDSSG